MRKQVSQLVLGLLSVLAISIPVHAMADSKGSKSSGGESRSSARSESSSRSESRSDSSTTFASAKSGSSRDSDSKNEKEESASKQGSEKSERGESAFGHTRGDDRGDWDASRHQQGLAANSKRPAMTPEAAALMTQARQAAFEYRTTGSAASLAALQSLQATLASMGFTRVPGGQLTATTPAAPAPTTPVATAPATTTGTVTGTSGVTAQ
jgi:hypothetical protein